MKRFLSFLLILAVFCVSFSFTASSVIEIVTGDADGNGKVDFEDYIFTRLASRGHASLEGDAFDAVDSDRNGVIEKTDAEFIKDYVCGKTSVLPGDCSHEGSIRSRDADGDVVLVCPICGVTAKADVPTNLKVAYIPIDDRPVNVDRVQYLAESIGFDLLMPETDLYRTCLDNMTPNKNGTTFGDRAKLLEWIKETDKECDYFIISLDQMLSGGLVSSRWLSNTDLTFEYEIADEIIELCENNTVILFDTVMRLASTANYMKYDYEKYKLLRSYGKVARRSLTGDELTIENIIAGYRYSANGLKISTALSEDEINKYHASRRRKLVLADYILKNAGENMDFIYYGVDDSSPQTTIQTNEINYIKGLIGDRGVLSAACDELGLCCLTRIACMVYGDVNVNVEYFGPGRDMAADEYDIGTLGSTIDIHLSLFETGKEKVTENALDVLILTRDYTLSDKQNLINRINSNIRNGVPTTVMNVASNAGQFGSALVDQCVDLCQLLGYSNWNTAGNALGISLSLGVARYAYLCATGKSTPKANEGFLKSMTFAYVKDLSYKTFHTDINGLLTDDYTCSAKQIIAKLNEGKIVTSVFPYTASKHGRIAASNARYPWNRNFEATFDINVYN